jgi:hypothetical protein
MKKYQRGLMAATLALSTYAATPAHAEVLNIPASASIYTAAAGDCGYYSGFGVSGIPNSCYFEIPLTIPAGHTIQQISVVHRDFIGPFPLPAYSASLSSIDFSTGVVSNGQFPWDSFGNPPNDALQVKRLMAQPVFPKNTYPDAFLVQPNTLYEVALHVEGSAIVTGLQVTYQ